MINKWQQLSWAERWLLLEATIWLALARLTLLFMPFRKIAPQLGQSQQETTATTSPYNAQRSERIGWAVRAIARRTPWESACLAQAISAKMMLRRRQIPSTLYLGLAKDNAQKMQAHAWLRCGEAILTGAKGHERFSVISFFADPTAHPLADQAPEPDKTKIEALLLATLQPDTKPDIVSSLQNLSEAEWGQLVQTAQKQHVATLLFAQLDSLGLQTAVPPKLWTNLQQKQKQITLQNMTIYRELSRINQALLAEKVPFVVLKGGYLAAAVYPHLGQRAMGDLDLLVRLENLPKMITALHDLGWRETRPISLTASLEQHHHLPPFAKKGVPFLIEPHWNITHPERPYSIDPAQLWQHVMPYTLMGSDVLVFQPHLQLLHLALHASYNHQFAFDLRSLCDIAMLIQKCGDDLAWEQVIRCAQSWHWQRGVYLTLALINEFWETAVPAHVLTQLQPENMPTNLIALTREHLFWGRLENNKVSRNFSRLSETDQSALTKVKFALSFLVPTRGRLAWRYGVPVNSPRIWFYYLVNFRDMVRRNTKRSWHLIRGKANVTKTAERRNLLASWLGESQ
ncbi:MAG: lasso peptide biosynthesis B2 protein [Chloroflexota bacterium]